MNRRMILFLLFLISLLIQAEFIIAAEICATGYIMDTYCAARGSFADNPTIQSLKYPMNHTAHCLLDIPACKASYEILKEPNVTGQDYTRLYKFDETGRQLVLSYGAKVGKGCLSCTGTIEEGITATVKGNLSTAPNPGGPPILNVTYLGSDPCNSTAPAPIPVSVPVAIPVSVPVAIPVSVPIAKPVSVPTPVANPVAEPSASAPSPCFSNMNTVETQDRGVVSMSQIKVGDFVKASNGEFTQVYGFGHVDLDYETEYLQFYFAMLGNESDVMSYHAQPLEITGRHLVFVEKNGRQYPVRASKVTVGDKLSDKVVASVGKVTRRGLYAPLTMSGDLVVSGVVASSYVDLLDYDMVYDHHTMGHALFSVQRTFCSYFIDTCKKEIYFNGYGPVARVLVGASDIINDLGWFANMVVGLLSVPVVATFYNCDSTILIMACVGASAWFATGRRSL